MHIRVIRPQSQLSHGNWNGRTVSKLINAGQMFDTFQTFKIANFLLVFPTKLLEMLIFFDSNF